MYHLRGFLSALKMCTFRAFHTFFLVFHFSSENHRTFFFCSAHFIFRWPYRFFGFLCAMHIKNVHRTCTSHLFLTLFMSLAHKVNITMAGMLRYGRCRLFQYTPSGEYLVYMLSYGVAIREYIEIRRIDQQQPPKVRLMWCTFMWYQLQWAAEYNARRDMRS